jgi:hypothetical protein
MIIVSANSATAIAKKPEIFMLDPSRSTSGNRGIKNFSDKKYAVH